MFPGGAAGLALMALRFCACCLLSLCAFTHVEFASPSWTLIGLGSILVLIGVGLLTPIACGLAAVIEFLYLLHSHGTDALHASFAIVITVAVALLGPGAFSVDAKLFGRRLIVPDQD